MVEILHSEDKNFPYELKRLLEIPHESEESLNWVVSDILSDVKSRGDAAVIEYTNRFDRVAINQDKLRVTENEVDAAQSICEKEHVDALEMAAKRIVTYHEKQLPESFEYQDEVGVTLGNRWSPIEKVGVYVPGGLASYPSAVLMSALPARVAGVRHICMTVPAPDGQLNPLVLAAAKIAGVDEIYRVGGAQAIAAMAYGTDTIPRVDKIVGPGNAYVASAKRQLFGVVGIDMVAGPSEILVVADNKNDPRWIAADLLSQAEHDKAARSFLITDDPAYAKIIEGMVEEVLAVLERKEIATASWHNNGAIIVVKDWDEAVEVIETIAPEHLELAVDEPMALADKIHNAGAIFLGRYTPEAIGDYTAGPSHVLPTSGTARFSSGLSVFDFLKRSSIIGCSKEAFDAIKDTTALLANLEGLDAHALSVTARNKKSVKKAS